MDKITRDILVILLSQQQKLRNEIEDLRRQVHFESEMSRKVMRSMAEILPAIQNLDDPEEKETMNALFRAVEKSECQPEVERAVAKLETANDALAYHTQGMIDMLKSIEFGEGEV